MSNRPPCKFFQQGRCTRGDNCSFSHAAAPAGSQWAPQQHWGGYSSSGTKTRGATVPAGAMPTMNGKLTKAAAEFWFPECRDCECCKGFKHGCSCCSKQGVAVCSCASGEEDAAAKQEQGQGLAGLPPPPPAGQQQMQQPVIVDLPLGTHIVSIDVECAATTEDHNGRAVCSVGMVDEFGRPLLDFLVRPQEGAPAVLSYLTPLTGVRREDVDARGVSLPEGLKQLRALLTPHTVIVGQNILKDMQWLGLREGADFGSLIDLSALFRVWNPRQQAFTNFSQDHAAKVWLGVQDRPSHAALEDAGLAMALFNAYRSVSLCLCVSEVPHSIDSACVCVFFVSVCAPPLSYAAVSAVVLYFVLCDQRVLR